MTEGQAKRPKFAAGLNLEGRRVVVIGGGRVAARRVEKLLASGAQVTVVAPKAERSICDGASRADGALLQWEARPAVPSDVIGADLVFLATNNEKLNADLTQAARAAGAWVNRADLADAGDFVVPMTWEQAGMQVALFAGNTSPALAKWISEQMQQALRPEIETFAEVVAEARRRVLARADWSQVQHAELIRRIVRGDVFALLLAHGRAAAESRVEEILAAGPEGESSETPF